MATLAVVLLVVGGAVAPAGAAAGRTRLPRSDRSLQRAARSTDAAAGHQRPVRRADGAAEPAAARSHVRRLGCSHCRARRDAFARGDAVTDPTAPPAPSAVPSAVKTGQLNLPTPLAASSDAPQEFGTTWTSSELGFSIQYDEGIWTVRDQDARSVVLTAARGNVAVVIAGEPAGDATPEQAANAELDRLGQQILGLTEETDPSLQLPGQPIVGYQPGIGNLFAGTLDNPQGPSTAVHSAILAATDDHITLLVSVTTVDQLIKPAFQAVDSMLNTINWGTAP